MSAETLDRLYAEAMQRLIYHINRSTGQHLRARRNQAAIRAEKRQAAQQKEKTS